MLTRAAECGKHTRMASMAVDRPTTPRIGAVARRVGAVALVVAGSRVLWALWEGYRWIWRDASGWTWPFPVNDDDDAAHPRRCCRRFAQPLQPGGPPLLHLRVALGAASPRRRRSLGFALGAAIGFVLGVAARALADRCSAALLPYIVASQTIPILAVAPMVVVWLGPKGVEPWQSRSR